MREKRGRSRSGPSSRSAGRSSGADSTSRSPVRSDGARRDRGDPRRGEAGWQLPAHWRDAVRHDRAVLDVRRSVGARAHRHARLRRAGAEVRRRHLDRARRRAGRAQPPFRGRRRGSGSRMPRADAGILQRTALITKRGCRPGTAGRSPCAIIQGPLQCDSLNGEVPKWSNGRASKACCRVTGTWVRIPPSPSSC